MKLTKRISALLLALLTLASLGCAAFAAEPEGELGARLDAFIAEHEDTTAGLAAAVFGKDDVEYIKYAGYADIEGGVPVDEETVFEWGSVTKLLVWVSAMQLVERGELDLEADVRTYLPEGFLRNLKFDGSVTMQNLMNHNAGFQELGVDIILPGEGRIKSLEEALRAYEPEQVYAPGTVVAYSNWGVALAGYIVERISGMSFADYVHKNIFQPLGMARTALMPDLSDNDWVREKRAELKCYGDDVKPLGKKIQRIWLYPCGMCTGTFVDFMSFARALLAEDSALFSSPETRALMFSPSLEYGDGTARNCHGFWVEYFGVPTLGHGGNTLGCSSYLRLDLENSRGAVVMTNQRSETVYNCDMMEEIFGTYSYDGPLPQGIYRSARVILRGPMKLNSLSYTGFEEAERDEYSKMYLRPDGVMSMPYGDYLPVSVPQFALEVGMALLLVLGVVFSIVYLLVRLVAAIVRRIKKKDAPAADAGRPLRTAAAATQSFLGVMVVSLWFLVFAVRSSWYMWVFYLAAILVPVLLVLAWRLFKKDAGGRKGIRALNVISAVFLITTAANIVFWQMYRFWAF